MFRMCFQPCAWGLAADHGSGWRRGLRRARRAVGGFASKPASALGHASAMRCIAANRHGSPLRGTLKATESGLKEGARFLLKPFRGISANFRVPPERRASVSEGLRTPPKVVSGRMTRARLASERGYRPLDLAAGEASAAPRFLW